MDAVSPSLPFAPRIRCESTFDRVSSLLMAVVIGATLIELWVGVAYFTNRAFAVKPPARVAIVLLANPSDDPAPPDEPGPEPSDTLIRPVVGLDEIVRRPTPRSLPRSERWRFEFPIGQTEDEYALLLDRLGIELGTPAGGRMLAYASNVSKSPSTRTGPSRQEKRAYLTWSTVTRRKLDLALLRKAGVKVSDDAITLQFLPSELVLRLSKAEFDYMERQPYEIRRTWFQVVRSGDTFEFRVMRQDLLDEPLPPLGNM